MSKKQTIHIDGRMGEGGGQVVRSSLTLSLLTGRPIHITGVRGGRSKPGILRQHLTAARAASEISGGRLDAELRGNELRFVPGRLRGGDYNFSIGSAGSALLVVQTILPALCLAGEPSRLTIEGGTHNPWSPTFDFFDRVFLPVLRRMGAKVSATLERPGFYPAGGGRIRLDVEPIERFESIELHERGEVLERRAVARVSNLSRDIAEREVRAAGELLGWTDDCLQAEHVESSGPGNVLSLEMRFENVGEICTGFGRMGARGDQIAREACDQLKRYLSTDAPVGRFLADQLILPLAIAGGGSFRTLSPSRHTTTQVDLVPKFLDVAIELEKQEHGQWILSIS